MGNIIFTYSLIFFYSLIAGIGMSGIVYGILGGISEETIINTIGYVYLLIHGMGNYKQITREIINE